MLAVVRSDQFFAGVLQLPADHIIDKSVFAVQIDLEITVLDGFNHQAVFFFVVPKGLFRALAPGDVHEVSQRGAPAAEQD